MKSLFVIASCALLSGCAHIGVTAYSDFSEQVSGDTHYRIGTKDAPAVQARAGVEVDMRVFNGFYAAGGIEHRSFPSTTADRGEERAYIGVRYHWGAK